MIYSQACSVEYDTPGGNHDVIVTAREHWQSEEHRLRTANPTYTFPVPILDAAQPPVGLTGFTRLKDRRAWSQTANDDQKPTPSEIK